MDAAWCDRADRDETESQWHGEMVYLPLDPGRIDIDQQASGEQWVSFYDSACAHGSHGSSAFVSKCCWEPTVAVRIAKA
ncbi:hypothetical protein ABH945_003235 [Paraburkholderia sp. GAS333]|uniref:hypothetical protein n=1 Tax=Paraburkholderia sp. GAS333 TaxID=3156279 RepID=UPI003D260BD2